jgi:hypothetical protein
MSRIILTRRQLTSGFSCHCGEGQTWTAVVALAIFGRLSGLRSPHDNDKNRK